jgi:MATE family multidrug resistance protein
MPQTLTRKFAIKEIAALAKLAGPVLVGLLANAGMGVLDVAMAGHASPTDLAGVSLGVSIWHIIIVTLMGAMIAISPLVSYHVGSGALSRIPSVLRQGLWTGLVVGLVAWGGALLASRLFAQMAIEPAVAAIATEFVVVVAMALPAFACFRVLYGYCTSLGNTRAIVVVALFGLVLCGVLNWCLVFGNAGFPRLGGVGCAWSNLVCVWASLILLVAWIRWSPEFKSTQPFNRFEWPKWSAMREMLRLGVPIGITYFAETSAFSLIALLVAQFGATEVSAHQIALNFTSLVFMVPMSLGVAVLTRVGHSLGANHPEQARHRAWVGVLAGLGFGVLSAAGIALFNESIAQMYTNAAEVAMPAAALLMLAAIFQLSDSTQVVVSNAIRAYKSTRTPMVIHLAAFWGVCLPLGYWLGLAPAWLPTLPWGAMKAQGFWIALVVGLSIAAVALLAYLHILTGRFIVKQR